MKLAMWKKYGWDLSGMLSFPPYLASCYLAAAHSLAAMPACCRAFLAEGSWEFRLAHRAERNLKLSGWWVAMSSLPMWHSFFVDAGASVNGCDFCSPPVISIKRQGWNQPADPLQQPGRQRSLLGSSWLPSGLSYPSVACSATLSLMSSISTIYFAPFLPAHLIWLLPRSSHGWGLGLFCSRFKVTSSESSFFSLPHKSSLSVTVIFPGLIFVRFHTTKYFFIISCLLPTGKYIVQASTVSASPMVSRTEPAHCRCLVKEELFVCPGTWGKLLHLSLNFSSSLIMRLYIMLISPWHGKTNSHCKQTTPEQWLTC